MTGPQLTRREIAAVLQAAVERLERLGVPKNYAVESVARDNNVAVSEVAGLVDGHGDHESAVM